MREWVKPLGAEIETELPEETIDMYIDRMLSDEKLNTKIRIPDEKSSMFRNYNPKFDLSKGDVHEQ